LKRRTFVAELFLITSKAAMPLVSPHEQNFSDDPMLANSNGDSERLGLESGD